MKRIITILSIITLVIWGTWAVLNNPLKQIVYAVGDLNIIWGVPDGNPIFVVTNMLPGDSESRTVTVINSASTARPVAVRGSETSAPGIFPGVLELVIREGVTDLYGGTSGTGTKTLQQFFDESTAPEGIALSTLPPAGTTQYTFIVSFPTSGGNEYQGLSVIFDITFGIAIPIPLECIDIEFSGSPIFGTQGNDTIHGTLKNDLIFALEGDDKVFGKLGDDCIVGGEGNDQLRGEVGKDIVLGSGGNDLVVGGNDADKLYGGVGDDELRGENGIDYIEGNDGDDLITGGNDSDIIHGNSGNDTMYGENGNDEMYGEAGNDFMDGGNGTDTLRGGEDNDTLHGKSGNDTLSGEGGTDSANGWSGSDTCSAEVETACEL